MATVQEIQDIYRQLLGRTPTLEDEGELFRTAAGSTPEQVRLGVLRSDEFLQRGGYSAIGRPATQGAVFATPTPVQPAPQAASPTAAFTQPASVQPVPQYKAPEINFDDLLRQSRGIVSPQYSAQETAFKQAAEANIFSGKQALKQKEMAFQEEQQPLGKLYETARQQGLQELSNRGLARSGAVPQFMQNLTEQQAQSFGNIAARLRTARETQAEGEDLITKQLNENLQNIPAQQEAKARELATSLKDALIKNDQEAYKNTVARYTAETEAKRVNADIMRDRAAKMKEIFQDPILVKTLANSGVLQSILESFGFTVVA